VPTSRRRAVPLHGHRRPSPAGSRPGDNHQGGIATHQPRARVATPGRSVAWTLASPCRIAAKHHRPRAHVATRGGPSGTGRFGPAPAGSRPGCYVAHVATLGPSGDTAATSARERDTGERRGLRGAAPAGSRPSGYVHRRGTSAAIVWLNSYLGPPGRRSYRPGDRRDARVLRKRRKEGRRRLQPGWRGVRIPGSSDARHQHRRREPCATAVTVGKGKL
jgi:hypothetical protein